MITPWTRFYRFVVVCVLLTTLSPQGHARDDVPVRKTGYGLQSDHVTVTFGYTDVFNKKVQKKLTSGLTTHIVLSIALENRHGKTVSVFARTVQVTYDLWEEDFVVVVSDPAGRRRTRIKRMADVIRAAGIVRGLPVGSEMSTGTYRLRVRAEANPVSGKMVRDIQKWISKPRSSLDLSGGSSYFSSFVGYFIDRDIGNADHSVRFVSQWFSI